MRPRSPLDPSAALTRGQRGASLTELLAVTAILIVAVSGLVPMLWLGGQSRARVDRHAEALHQARRAADKLVRDMRAARSFQLVSPALVRAVVARGDGSGATPTVEYAFDGATGELRYRVAADFAYRRRITVTAGSAAVPAGYSIPLIFNHAALVTAGKSLASGDDVRVLYWTGTRWIELDRFRDIPSAWNTAATQVWFKLQAPLPASGSNNNYYLHYGDPASGPPPANGDYVFLDYEDGTTLADWIRRDACNGTYTASSDGFLFQSTTTSCYRRMSKAAAHSDVEIFWGFRSDSPTAGSNRHQVGVGARLNDAGAGYLVTPADATNARLRIRYVTSWASAGSVIAQTGTGYSITPGVDYYGRFYLVGSAIRAKYWIVGTAEPAWLLQTIHSLVASGPNHAQVDGQASPETHRHRHIIVRQRVDPEPTAALAPEESGTRADAFAPFAGPFRAMAVRCFDNAGSVIACGTPQAIRSVEVALTTMDPTGEVADIVVTSRAYRQAP
jgi:type II secretory pathway pseudopilin PulG